MRTFLRLSLSLPALLLLLAATAALGAPPTVDPGAALREGNHLFRGGDLDKALEAYAAGWNGEDPVLAYNLGTTAHHLGRLPEALLWYRRARRAETGLDDDPWLRDNLRLVREQLRAESPVPAETAGWRAWAFWMDFWMDDRPRLLYLVYPGIALAWATLLLLVLPVPPPLRRRAVAPAALVSCLAFSAGMLLPRIGARPAVLLEDCKGAAGGLPAGSEIWAAPAPDGGWRILGGRREKGLRCPAGAVGLVDP